VKMKVAPLLTLGRKRIPFALLIGLIVFLFLIPQIFGDYVLYLAIRILILCLLALSVNLLLGYTGLLSFGQGGLFAIGGYSCAKILLSMDSPSLLAGLIGGLVVVLVASLILGFFCIRHTAIYFAMITLSFGMMLYAVLVKWRSFTGGDDGLMGIPRAPLAIPNLFNINIALLGNYYYFVLILSLAAIFVFYRVVHSPLGLTFQAMRDSESRVSFIGISVRNTRLLCFAIAGLYAGLAGILIAPMEQTLTPVASHWSTSMEPIIAVLIGGMSFAGPLVGSVIFFVMKDVILRCTMYWMLPLGIIVVVLVMILPGGFLGTLERGLMPHISAYFTGKKD
jgi:branched-chain amino acid transport system permease protein